MRLKVRTIGIMGTAALMLAVPASASAVERFAAALGGSAVDLNCTGTPCTLEHVVEDVALDDDIVTVLPGAHVLAATLDITDQIELRGPPGQAIPTISSTAAGTAATVSVSDAGAVLRRLTLTRSDAGNGTGDAIFISQPATIDSVTAISSTVNQSANGCAVANLLGTVEIQNTVCASVATQGHGFGLSPGVGVATVNLRNVTAHSAGDDGISTNTPGGRTLTVNATNVIADGSGNDIRAQGAGTSAIVLDHSNYDDPLQAGGATITPDGADPSNQDADVMPPLFVSAGTGNLHQDAGSPTKNAGATVFADLERSDVDGEARFLGTATDIGADELTQAAPADVDSDGLVDVFDTCVNEPGPSSNGGCPIPVPPDTDGDGVPDSSDNCVAEVGPADNNGCPVLIVCATQPQGPGCATPDTTSPETTIGKGPKGTIAKDSALLKFSSSETGSTFRCKLDKAKFKLCTSPRRLRKLSDGRHTFKVVAVDPAGNEDATPATLRFRVKTKEEKDTK